MNEILESSDSLDIKLQKLDKWINTIDAIENLYLKTGFGAVYIPFAITALETIKPDKATFNYHRNLVLRILYRLKIYDSTNLSKLSDLIIKTVNYDNIHNVSLAYKCLALLFKKSKFEPEKIQAITEAFSSLLEDIMKVFRMGNEKHITQTLHVFSESLPFLGMLLRSHPNSVDKFDKITRELYTFAILFMSKNEFNVLINNNETIMVELINFIFRIIKYFMDLYMTTGKDFSTKSSIPEMCMFIVNFCPNDAEILKKEIYQQITHYCISCRDLFYNYIDIFLSDNILIKPVPKKLRFLGVYFATEIAAHYKDKINKENLMKIIKATCHTIEIEFSLCEGIVTENRKTDGTFVISKENYSILFSLLNTLLKINEIFSLQKYSYYEKHAYYMKILYEVFKVFCVLTNYVANHKQEQSGEVKTLLKICIRIIKNTMHYFGTIKETVPNLIHSLKCFSQDEISKFAKLMHFSLKLFSHEMFTEDDKLVIDEMYVIFVYLEEPNFISIVTANISYLFQYTKKNRALFIVWKFYLGIKTVLMLFYGLLIDELMGLPFNKEDEAFFIQAYDVIFKALYVFPKEADMILAQRIEAILQSLTVETNDLFYKYQILRSFFNAIENCETAFPAIYRVLSTKINGIVKTLTKHHKVHPHEHVITEILLLIPKKFIFIISQLKLFIGPLQIGLEVEQLKTIALSLLNLCIDNLQAEFIDENTDGKIYEIFVRVLELTKEEKYAESALSIIYKYKGDKRLLQYKANINNYNVAQDITICNESIKINIEPLLYRCFEILRGKCVHHTSIRFDTAKENIHIRDFNRTIFEPSENKEKLNNMRNAAFKFIVCYIHKTIGWSDFKKDNVVEKTTRSIKEMVDSGFYVDDKFDILTGIDKTNYLHIMRLTKLSLADLLQLKKNIYDATMSLFFATQYECSEEANRALDAIYHTVLVYKVIESFKLGNAVAKIHFDYFSFIDPLLECFSHDNLMKVSERCLLTIYDSLFDICGDKIIIAKVNLYNELLSKLIVFAYYADYYKRKSALNGILFILKNIDCGVEFVHSFRCHIFKAMYIILRDASTVEVQKIKEILNLIVLKTYNLPNHDYNEDNITDVSKIDIIEDMTGGNSMEHNCMDKNRINNNCSDKNCKDKNCIDKQFAESNSKTSGFDCSSPDIVYQLLLGLQNVSSTAKKVSQSMLEYLAELRGQDVTELISPYKNILIREIKHWSLDHKKQTTMFNYFLEKLSYILMLRPPLVNVHDDLINLVNLILSKHGRFLETHLTDRCVKSMPIYFTFAYTALTVVEDKALIEKLLIMFSTGLFTKTETSEISSKALKFAYYKHPELTKEVLYTQFKPTFSTFLHDKVDIQILHSVIQILEVINNQNKTEIVEKLGDIFKMREDVILTKALEIASLLPGYFPEQFLSEIVDVTNFLEQRDKLFSDQKNKNILKEICEKNLNILKFYLKRLNDFCIFRILRSLVRASSIIKGFLKDNPTVDDNLYSILLFKEAGGTFLPIYCFSAIRVYQDLRQRNKDAYVIKDLLRSISLSHENINMLFEIDDEFFFNDPKERFLINGLSFYSRKKLLENYIRIKENAPFDNSPFVEITSIEDLRFYNMLENYLENNIDMDSRGKIFTIFYLDKVYSKKVAYHCNMILGKNFSIKYKAILYLSAVEPKEYLLEPTLQAHSEFKSYTEKSLENLTAKLEPEKYTDLIMNCMKNQTNYKNNLFVLYPLFVNNPDIISPILINDLFDAICRLFATMVPIHQKLAIKLLEKIYDRYEYLIDIEDESDIKRDTLKGISICYTIFFSNVCHLKDDSIVSKLKKFRINLNLKFLFFVEENINYNNFSQAIRIELDKDFIGTESQGQLDHNEIKDDLAILQAESRKLDDTYSGKIGLCVNKYIRKCFCDAYMSEKFVDYVEINFLLQYINKFIEMPDNFRTAKIVFKKILEIRKESLNLGISDVTLFDVFVRILNIFSMSHGEYVVEVLKTFEPLTIELNVYSNLIKALDVLMSSKVFTHKSEVAKACKFLLHNKEISLADKVALLNSFRYTQDDNLSYVLPFFKERSDIVPILKRPFLAGLKLHDKFLRDEFYELFNGSISKGIFPRLKYLLTFDWQLYGDNWLYAVFRMCLMVYQDLKLVSTKFYVFGDDSYYENIYERIRVSTNTNSTYYKIKKDIEPFIERMLADKLDELNTYDIPKVIEYIYDLLLNNHNVLVDLFPTMLHELMKKLSHNEVLDITEKIIQFASREETNKDTKVLFKALYLLVTNYSTIELKDMKMELQEIVDVDSKPKFTEKTVEGIRQRISASNYTAIAEKTGAYYDILELLNDKNKKDIYNLIQDEDMYHGSILNEAKHPETISLLLLEQRKEYEKALVINEKLQNLVVNNELTMEDSEYEIMEIEWIKCAKKLQQWDVLYDVGNNMGDCILSTDACFRNNNFLAEQERQTMASIVNLRPPSREKRFFECFLDFMSLNERPELVIAREQSGIYDNKHAIKDRLKNLKQSFLNSMLQGPLSIPSSCEKLTYIRCIDEMIKIPMTYDFIPFSDTLRCWDLFSTFRLHLYDYIIRFDTSKKFYHEKAKMLSAFCRKLKSENSLQATLYNLQRIFTLPSIEATDAYDKIINEVKILIKLGHYDNALDIINSCNINFFDTARKANIYGWKCIIHEKKEEYEEAQKNILYSVQIDGGIGKNWYIWGIFLNKKLDKTILKINEISAKLLQEKEQEGSYQIESLTKQRHALREELEYIVNNAFSAFLQSTIMTSGSMSRRSFLRLIKYFKYENEIIKTTFLAQKDDLDVSKYFFFTPQLVDLLCSETHFCAEIILNKMLEKYPQSIFIPVRRVLEKLTKASERNGKTASHDEITSRLLNLIEPSNYNTANTFRYSENLIKTLVEKFEPTIEDNCHKICYVIYNESIGILFNDSEYSYETLLSMIERLLTVVEKSKLKRVLTLELQKDFENYKSLNLFEIAKVAFKWKGIFCNILRSIPLLLNLSEISNVHANSYMASEEIHVFGQYNEIKSVYDDFVTIENFEPTYVAGWRNSVSLKVLNIRGSDGRVHPFIFIDLIGVKNNYEVETLQFAHFLDSEMKHELKLESFIDLTDEYRLHYTHDMFVFFEEIIDGYEIKKEKTYSNAVFKFIELVQKEKNDTFEIDTDKKVRYNAYTQIISEFGDDVLCSYFRNHFKDADTYHLFSNNIMRNYAAQAFLFHVISVGYRAPSKIAFGRRTGVLLQLGAYPCPKKKKNTTLRLTPNIQKLYGHVGIAGIFTKIGFEMCIDLTECDYFKDLIYIIFKDHFLNIDEFYNDAMERIKSVMDNPYDIVNRSTDPMALCMESPLWQAWF